MHMVQHSVFRETDRQTRETDRDFLSDISLHGSVLIIISLHNSMFKEHS